MTIKDTRLFDGTMAKSFVMREGGLGIRRGEMMVSGAMEGVGKSQLHDDAKTVTKIIKGRVEGVGNFRAEVRYDENMLVEEGENDGF